jgi:phage portal protein BeeE
MGITRDLLNAGRDYFASRDEAKAYTLLSRDDMKSAPPMFTEQGIGGGNVVQTFSNWTDFNAFIDQALSRWRGSKINYATAVGDLRLSVLLMAAIGWAGTNASMGRWQVAEIGKDEKETPILDHPFVQLFDGEENPDFQNDILWRQWMVDWILFGEGYALFGRDNAGRIKEIYYEPRNTIRPRHDRNLFPDDPTANTFIQYFEINRNGRWIPWRKQDTFRTYWILDPITRRGFNGVQALLRTIFTDNEREQYTGLLLTNCGVSPVALAPKQPGLKFDHIEFQDRLERRFSGDERGKPAVFTEPMESIKFATDYSADAMERIAHISESRVAAALGISAQSLKFMVSQQSSTYNNVQAFRKEDFEQWVVPTRNSFRVAAQKQILRDMDDDRRHVLRDDYSQVPIMQPDKIAERRSVVELFKGRVIDQAEAREAVSYEHAPKGDEGKYKDVYYPVPATTTTAERIEEMPSGEPVIPSETARPN